MKRIVTVYGLIAGAIVSGFMTIGMVLMQRNGGSTPYGMAVGYASMLLAFIFIFIAVRNYRDKHLDGSITFGKAFTTGLGVAIIASVCYTVTWVIIYKGFFPEFMEVMTRNELVSLQKSGKSPAEIAKATEKMEEMKAMYATWPGLIGMTLIEILPLGILVALISAAILRRKQPDTAGSGLFANQPAAR